MPVGLIATAIGGTAIQSWTSAAGQARFGAACPRGNGDTAGSLWNINLAPFARTRGSGGPMRVAGFVWFQVRP